MTMLNDLPTVVDGAGLYETRDGRLAEVRDVVATAGGVDVTAFAVKGAIVRRFRNAMRARGLRIWHVSGRSSVFGEQPSDLVRRKATDVATTEQAR